MSSRLAEEESAHDPDDEKDYQYQIGLTHLVKFLGWSGLV
jgi:hypothetical protein